ncbi:hypothetical protein [Piscirickettsia salmonis]|nr:hypothetical protein [Piscirickettsia salmonis]QHS25255.1 hypothetical protein GW538_03980 [Piscirickettsia salmonis]QHS28456.1 hypothetical protein GW537_03960 [Piscirickettsia salmonis]
MLGDFASLDVQNTYRGSDAYANLSYIFFAHLAVISRFYPACLFFSI